MTAIETTLPWVRIMLARFTYKPNFEFGATEREGHVWITGRMWVENSRTPFNPWDIEDNVRYRDYRSIGGEFQRFQGPVSPIRELVPIHISQELPEAFYGERHFWDHLRIGIIQELEMHEVGEWFKVDGFLPYDPHPPSGANPGALLQKNTDSLPAALKQNKTKVPEELKEKK